MGKNALLKNFRFEQENTLRPRNKVLFPQSYLLKGEITFFFTKMRRIPQKLL